MLYFVVLFPFVFFMFSLAIMCWRACEWSSSIYNSKTSQNICSKGLVFQSPAGPHQLGSGSSIQHFNLTLNPTKCYPTYHIFSSILCTGQSTAICGCWATQSNLALERLCIAFYQLTSQTRGIKREAMNVYETLIQQQRIGSIVLSVHRSLPSLLRLWLISCCSKHWLAEDRTTAVCVLGTFINPCWIRCPHFWWFDFNRSSREWSKSLRGILRQHRLLLNAHKRCFFTLRNRSQHLFTTWHVWDHWSTICTFSR